MASRWYYEKSGSLLGPLGEDDLRDMVRKGSLDPSTRLFSEDDSTPGTLGSVLGLGPPAEVEVPEEVGEVAPLGEVLPPKKVSVWLTILLSFVTLGIYVPVWFLSRFQALNTLRSPQKLSRGLLITLTVVFTAASVCNLTFAWTLSDTGWETWDEISRALSVLLWIAVLTLCFAVRSILQDHIRYQKLDDAEISGVLPSSSRSTTSSTRSTASGGRIPSPSSEPIRSC